MCTHKRGEELIWPSETGNTGTAFELYAGVGNSSNGSAWADNN